MFSCVCEEPSPATQLQQNGVRTAGASYSPALDSNEETILGRSATLSGTRRSRSHGFSMVELAVSLTVVLILTAIAIPSLMRSFRTYQLNDAAGRLSDMLKFTRFEAVRQNKQINFLTQTDGLGNWIIGVDANNNGNIDASERQQVIAGFAALLPAGAPPSSAPILAYLSVAALTTMSGINNASVTFDSRGAVRLNINGAVSSNVEVFYLGSVTNPEYGYRAVILLPSGAVQIWTAPIGGPWQRVG
jgi:prepilin-type N-terminal cleavage/methylation domain-containing protein